MPSSCRAPMRIAAKSVPESEARLAYVTSFTGSAGLAIVGAKQGGAVRRRPLHPAGPGRDRHQGSSPLLEASAGRACHASHGRLSCRKGAKARLRPVAAYPDAKSPISKRSFAGKATLVPVANLVDQDLGRSPCFRPTAAIEFLGHNRAGKTAPDKLAEIRAIHRRGQRRRPRPDRAGIDQLAVQPARPRRAACTGGARASRWCRKSGMPTLFVNKDKITPELKPWPRRPGKGRRRRDHGRGRCASSAPATSA
jgi:Xaa-Pro aminopeptidase